MDVEHLKPRTIYVEEATAAALDSRWEDAAELNRKLIELHGEDVSTLNRLGKALLELGRVADAADAYQQALKLDPENSIAAKNVAKISRMSLQSGPAGAAGGRLDMDLFAEEAGRSALTLLIPPAEPVTAKVQPGDVVRLVEARGALAATTTAGVALGEIEPKIGRRLLGLMATGNHYAAAVARVNDSGIEVIVREAYQSPANVRKTSFPVSRRMRKDEIRPYSKGSLVAALDDDEPDVEGFADIFEDEPVAASSRPAKAVEDEIDDPDLDDDLATDEPSALLDEEDDEEPLPDDDDEALEDGRVEDDF